MTPTFRFPSQELLLVSPAAGVMTTVRAALGKSHPDIALTILSRFSCLTPHLSAEDSTCPDLILLDLPASETLEAVRLLKGQEALHEIPVVALVPDPALEDYQALYNARVNCCIERPSTEAQWEYVARSLVEYWFEVVRLPSPGRWPRPGTLDW